MISMFMIVKYRSASARQHSDPGTAPSADQSAYESTAAGSPGNVKYLAVSLIKASLLIVNPVTISVIISRLGVRDVRENGNHYCQQYSHNKQRNISLHF